MQDRFKTFTVLVDKIKRSIRKIKTEEMAEFDLKSPHVSCLYYLYKSKPLTSKELSEICEEDKAAVSRSIEYLEENGYLVCVNRTRKRYKAPLALTEKGIEVAKLAGIPNEVIRRAKEVLASVEKTVKAINTVDAVEEEKDDSLISMDDFIHEQVIAELKAVDLNTLSPYEAMSFLFDLKKRLK